MPRTLAYSIVDVFAEEPLAGNQLAIFHDARGLSDAELQSLARETNLSETTFIFPADDETDGVRVRIFTTEEEFPFAGHPTLGTASWLWLNHPTLRGADTITLQLNVGPVPVRFTQPSDGELGVQGTMQQPEPIFGRTHDIATIANLLGLEQSDLDPHHAPQTVSTGLPFCIVPLASLEASQRLQIRQSEAKQYLANDDAKFFYTIAPAAQHNTQEGPHWHARMQFYGGEDPATGSAAGCAIAYLVHHELAASGVPTIIEQGIEMLRPSRITTQASVRNNVITKVLVSGRTIPVAQGSFFLPFEA